MLTALRIKSVQLKYEQKTNAVWSLFTLYVGMYQSSSCLNALQ